MSHPLSGFFFQDSQELAMLSEVLLVSAPGKVILHGEHAVVHGKVKAPRVFENWAPLLPDPNLKLKRSLEA